MTRLYHPSVEEWNWITLSGPDAQDFLHRLTTADLRNLPLGQGTAGCFLTPQGKIRATFNLWHYSEKEFAFEFAAGQGGKWKANLLAAIDQFTFGEKMTLTDPSEKLSCRWIFPDLSKTSNAILELKKIAPGETRAIDAEIRICRHLDLEFGRPWYTAWGLPEKIEAWTKQAFPGVETVAPALLDQWRIQNSRPRVDHEISEEVTPLEIGLRNAIAEQKGCYPGQEVIEKIIALGSPPRRLVKIEGSLSNQEPLARLKSDSHSKAKLFNLANPPIEIGQITSISFGESNIFQALGLVKKIHAKEGMEVQIQPPSSQSSAESASNSESNWIQGRITQVAPYL